jgi:adenine deaminase
VHLASSVAHDSHNIIVVGVDDESMCKAVNAIVQEKGGLSVTDGNQHRSSRFAGCRSDEHR